MASMKVFAECVSESMGLDGEITDEVMQEASRRLAWVEKANRMTLDFVSLDDVELSCAECPRSDGADWRITPDNRLLCTTCFDEEYFTCCDCDEVTDNDEATAYGDGQLCESCYSNGYFTCDHCSSVAPDRHCTDVDGESWCNPCRSQDATHCSDCGCYTQDDNAISCSRGSLCQSCYENDYFTCDECDEVCHNDHYGEEGRCQDCTPEDPDGILDYDSDVLRILGVRPDVNKILYGIELEVETINGDPSSSAYDCRDKLGENFVITKHDGSLSDDGFEIVSIPASLVKHTRVWSRFLESVPSGLRSWETSGRCGMHVHVSRAPLSLLSIGKILVFINAEENRDFVTLLAGRDSCGYSEYRRKKITDCKTTEGKRGQSVNLQNSDTIEFRIFKGTLKKSAFLKNLEFVVATVAFCQQAGIHGLDVPSFLAWFKPVRKDYPNLDAWLVNHGHIKPRSKPVKARAMKGGE